MKMNRNGNIFNLLPLLLSFFATGFIFQPGITTEFMKPGVPDTIDLANLFPGLIFLCFGLVSIPASTLVKNTNLHIASIAGLVMLAAGLMIPFIRFSALTFTAGLLIAGSGIAVFLVASLPLVHVLSPPRHKAANLVLAFLFGAAGALSAPVIAVSLGSLAGDRKFILPLWAGLALLAAAWLYLNHVREKYFTQPISGPGNITGLLKGHYIRGMLISVFLLTGFIVVMNAGISPFLLSRFPVTAAIAGNGPGFFTASVVTGLFTGAFFLRSGRTANFLYAGILVAFMGLTGIMVTREINLAKIMIFVTGLGFSYLLPATVSMILERMPDRSGDLSSLIVMSMAGGFIIPPAVDLVTKYMGIKISLLFLFICLIWVFFAVYETPGLQEDEN